MSICIVEDEGYKKLLPLVWMRPVWDLVCGASTILGKIKRAYPKEEVLFNGRDYLVKAKAEAKAKEINGRTFPKSKREIAYPWDLLTHLKEDLSEDLDALGRGIKGEVHSSAVIYNKENVLIEKGATVEACAVLDARQGPIYIGEGTVVHPGSLLRGPLSIGKHCRIGGEVVASIIMDYVNKGHFGFLGHSYICPWVNLGAGTTNSNLKNNYKGVKVFCDGKMIDSKETFVGSFIGDHAKTAIGTLLYTGCVVGVAANLFGQPYFKKFIPSFSWGGKGEARLEDVLETERAMMKRRGIDLSKKDTELLKKVFELTKSERI